MSRNLNAQTFGSLVVIGAFLAAESSARFLDACPASVWAWYLNLEVFRVFEVARIGTSPLRHLFGWATLPLAAALALVTLGLRHRRLRFGLALVANLSFGCAAAMSYTFVTYGWLRGAGGMRSASIQPTLIDQGSDVAVLVLMLASSFLACAVSHLTFAGRILADRRGGIPESR